MVVALFWKYVSLIIFLMKVPTYLTSRKVYVSEIGGPNRSWPLGRWKDKVKQYESVCERGAT